MLTSAILVLIALVGIILAALAYKASLHIFRYQLFDRRMRVYEAAEQLIQHGQRIRPADNIVGDVLQPFLRAQELAYFLGFEDDVYKYLEELLTHHRRVGNAFSELQDLPSDVDKKKLSDIKHEELEWFTHQFSKGILRDTFYPALGVWRTRSVFLDDLIGR